MILECEHSLLI